LILLLAAEVEGLYQLAMIFRTLVLFFAAVIFAGCPAPEKKPQSAKGKKEQPPPLKDQTGDASFQAFVGRLRKAVETRDKAMLTSMMSPDFGYRWDDAPAGETPFAHWDRQQLWGQLSALLRERWTPHDAFMVVPPQFAQSDSYPGYRAGLTMVNGSWRFAYFVPAPPAGGGASQEVPEERPLPPLPE
jgi:hypothetical protein